MKSLRIRWQCPVRTDDAARPLICGVSSGRFLVTELSHDVGSTTMESVVRNTQILGVAVLVIGAILLAFGFHAANAPVEQLSDTFLGRYTNETMWMLLGGGVAAVCGLTLVIFGSAK